MLVYGVTMVPWRMIRSQSHVPLPPTALAAGLNPGTSRKLLP